MSIQEEKLQAIADAIREKDGTTELIPANDFPDRIRAIEIGSSFAVPLVVTADVGTVITAVNGDTTITGTVGDSGSITLTLPSPGDWNVSAQLGDTIKGPEIVSVQDGYTSEFFMASRLPAGYTEVEYVTRDGVGKYFEAAGPISLTKKYYLRMMIESYGSSGNQHFLDGTYPYKVGTSTYTPGVMGAVVPGNQYRNIFAVLRRTTETPGSFSTDNGQDYLNEEIEFTIDIPNKKAKIAELEGVLNYTFTSFYLMPKPCVFGNSSSINLLKGRLYSYKEYDNNVLIADYVPCINPDGVVGVFDVVREIFVNPTGTFTAGPAV